MLERLPERVRTRSVARAVVSPSAILAAGAGAAAVIAGGLPLVLAPLAAAGAWLVRVAMAVPRKPAGEAIDPFAVGDPWRRMVIDAQQAEKRFQEVVGRTRSGPLRERLADVGSRIQDGVRECWRIAVQGDALEAAYDHLDVRNVQDELAELERSDHSRDATDRTRRALESQLASAERIATIAHDARDRLRVLNAQLDEAVARAVELSVSTVTDAAAVRPLTDEVESIVGDLESLRQGMEEATSARPMPG